MFPETLQDQLVFGMFLLGMLDVIVYMGYVFLLRAERGY